jgi:hypothetical protein
MPEAISDLVSEIQRQGSFDATSEDVLAWLNRRHKEMVNFARAYRDTLDLGDTVAGTQEYAVPAGVVEALEITVGGVTWTRGRHTDIAADAGGWLWLSGTGGLVVPSATAASASVLALIPSPDTSGQEILMYAITTPPSLLIDDTVPLQIDDDMVEGLLAGVFAVGLGRPGQGQPGDAATQEQAFQGRKIEFKQRVARRLRGSGPVMIRVRGQNA